MPREREHGIAFPDAVYNYHHAPKFFEDCTACSDDEQNCSPMGCRRAVERGGYRLCCDENGCCCMYPASCRNRFWPEFSHPRWLCCKDLYDGGGEPCYDCCPEEEASPEEAET